MEISIKHLVWLIARLTACDGKIVWDTSKLEKLFGFRAQTPFEEGLRRTMVGIWPLVLRR